MDRVFQITQRHYSTILKQGLDNLPQEAGGFVGGKNDEILAILPLFNQHLYDKTDTFSFTQEDIYRAHSFFQKHDLTYFGLYHTHPNGVAYPSKEDIATGHRYHFILSLRNPEAPVFAAYEIIRSEPHYIPIKVIADKGHTPIDIHTKEKKREGSVITQRSSDQDVSDLNDRINNIRESRENKYDRMPPLKQEGSDFSTFA